MQVSWIDPNEIARLAAQLEGPLKRDESPTWDVNTLPETLKGVGTEIAPGRVIRTLDDGRNALVQGRARARVAAG